METRKIQQVGGGTYTVSLPKEWATASDIEPGSAVSLYTHIDGTLVIQTGTEGCTESTPLGLTVTDADPASIERFLRAAYAAGIETVEFDAPDGLGDAQIHTIERVTRDLTGVTITESTAETVQVRSLLDAGEVSLTQSVRQLQFAALSAHRDATAAVSTPATVDQPADRDDQADRLYAMVDRYFQRGLDSLTVMDALGLTRPELFVRWVTARELERVADHAQRIATVGNRLDDPIEDNIAEQFDALAERTRDLVRDAVSVVVDDAGTPTSHRVLDERDQLCGDIAELDRTLFDAESADYRLTHALDGLRRTAHNAGSIAELGLRDSLRNGLDSETSLPTGAETP